MQPTTLPWLGYFALIDYVDVFVFLNDVQFDKRSWQQRNKINTNGSEKIITIPVLSKKKSNQLINQVEIDINNLFPDKFIKSIFHSYSKTKYFNKYFEDIVIIIKKNKMLADLNINLIKFCSKKLHIENKFQVSSLLNIENSKGRKLFEIAKHYKCTKLISPKGSKNYLKDVEGILVKEFSINLEYFNFIHPVYNHNNHFLSNMSIIDLLFNHGDASLEIIRSGIK
jgi:hypothetical protein